MQDVHLVVRFTHVKQGDWQVEHLKSGVGIKGDGQRVTQEPPLRKTLGRHLEQEEGLGAQFSHRAVQDLHVLSVEFE
jgi:hypothetical protein